MKPLISKVRPKGGFAWLLHTLLLSLLPIIVFTLVRIEFAFLALAVIVLSKWRMFAVKPRFWLANVRANSVDILVGMAAVTFMTQTSSMLWQFVWVIMYILWLTIVKPSSQKLLIAVQALVAFVSGLSALYVIGDDWNSVFLVLGTGLVCYVSAHHFLDAFEEVYARLLSYTWGFFGAALAWVLSHWLTYYPVNGFVAQPVLLLLVIGYGLSTVYYLDHTDKLSKALKTQFITAMVLVTLIVLWFSDWGDKIV
jgi:hypothetical protein